MILVTGGAGFIGGNFVLDWLANPNAEGIVNLDKLTYAGNLVTLESLDKDARHVFVQGDIGDYDLVLSLLKKHQIRAVVNFAAESHVDRSIHGPGGNAVYTKAADRAMQIYNEGIKSNANDLISQTPVILADTFNTEADPKMLEQRVAVEKQRVFDIAKQAGPEFLREKLADFDRQLLNSVVDYASSPAFASNALDGLRRIQNNDFGKMSDVMKRVDKNKLLKAYSDRMGEVATAWKRAADLENNTKIDVKNSILDQFYMGNISGSVAMQRIKAEGNLGMTAAILIETSHIALHVWDEKNPAELRFDLYTCGDLDGALVRGLIDDQFGVIYCDWQLLDREGDLRLLDYGRYSLPM